MSDQRELDALFMGLVLNIHGSALQYLGKIASPIDGKTERNLEAAKQTIDLLAALESKTRGNLSTDEEKAFREMLMHLQLNYVEEAKGDAEASVTSGNGEEPAAAAGEAESGDDRNAGD